MLRGTAAPAVASAALAVASAAPAAAAHASAAASAAGRSNLISGEARRSAPPAMRTAWSLRASALSVHSERVSGSAAAAVSSSSSAAAAAAAAASRRACASAYESDARELDRVQRVVDVDAAGRVDGADGLAGRTLSQVEPPRHLSGVGRPARRRQRRERAVGERHVLLHAALDEDRLRLGGRLADGADVPHELARRVTVACEPRGDAQRVELAREERPVG